MNLDPESAMLIGAAKINILLPYCHSLKEKRHVIHKIKGRLWSDFQVSAHEVGFHDKWQRAQIGLALVGVETKIIASLIDKIQAAIPLYGLGEVVDIETEIIRF